MLEAFTSLLSTLAPALGLPEITLREDDPSCLLVIDDFEVSLRYLPGADAVMLFTVVAPLPEEGRNELYAALLDANTFFRSTQGFTLAAREDTGVTLQGVMPLRVLDDATIVVWLQNFVTVAEMWQETCINSKETPSSDETLSVFPQDMLRV